MKKVVCVMLAVVLSMVLSAVAGQQDFTLVNDTGVEIHQIFISSAATDSWEEDLLGDDGVLPNGNEVEINFSPDEDAELWDVRIVDNEGTAIDWERLKLTEITKLTLQIEDGEPTASIETVADATDEADAETEADDSAEVAEQDFTLVNNTDVEIHQIFISTSDTADWEEDLLGDDNVLPAGNELEIKFSPDEDAELWDVRVVDGEGTAIDWTGLKLTEITKLTLQIEDGEPTATIE